MRLWLSPGYNSYSMHRLFLVCESCESALKEKSTNLVILIVSTLVVLMLFSGYYLLNDEASSNTPPAAREDSSPDANASSVGKKPQSLEQDYIQRLNEAASESKKIAVLEDYSRESSAIWQSPLLAKGMTSPDHAKLRTRAYQVARDLAHDSGDDETVALHQKGIRSMYSNVKREALASCRDKPHFELLDELIDIAEKDVKHRHLAVQALAFMDSAEAQRKVLEVAQSPKVERAVRVQAILLLSRTTLSDAIAYLQELSVGEDLELSNYAIEALDLLQKRKSGE